MFAAPRGAAFYFQNLMLAPSSEPTVASVFAPRTTIDADGTVGGYASLFGEIDQARDGHARRLCRHARGAAGSGVFRRCSSTTLPSRHQARTARRSPRSFCTSRRETRTRAAIDLARRCHRWVVDRFSYSEGPHRFANAHPSHLCGRPLGDLDRHVPDADGCTRAQREARASRKFAHRRPDSPSGNCRVPRNPKSSMTRFS
jgi:hypothetical protein